MYTYQALPTPSPFGYTCKRCEMDEAETPEFSRFQLCESCSEDVYPGSDAARYRALVIWYGYPEA
jgi:hypothetical protein